MPGKKKGTNNTRIIAHKHPIQYAKEGQQYATVILSMGNCQFNVRTIKNEDKLASLCGKIKRAGRVIAGDYVLIEPISDVINSKFQIVFKYSQTHVKELTKTGAISLPVDPTSKESIAKKEEEADDGFVFATEADEQRLAYKALLTGTNNTTISKRYHVPDELEQIKETFGTHQLDDI